jgi:hypothetical protein
MTAVEIIEEILHLAPGEKVRVVQYVRTLDDGRALNGPELTEFAGKLAGEIDPGKPRDLKDQITAGF